MNPAWIALLAAQVTQNDALSARLDASTEDRFFIGVKAGPYLPNLDAEFSEKTPLQDILGKKLRPRVLGEVGYMFTEPFGQFYFSVSAGHTRATGQALVDNGVEDGELSGGKTTLSLTPVIASVGYRTTAFLRWVPVLPYGRLGLSYTFWEISKGDGETAVFGTQKARGGAFGLVLSAGAALPLELIEPRISKLLYEQFRIVGSELSAELVYTRTRGLGSALELGDLTFQLGYSIAF